MLPCCRLVCAGRARLAGVFDRAEAPFATVATTGRCGDCRGDCHGGCGRLAGSNDSGVFPRGIGCPCISKFRGASCVLLSNLDFGGTSSYSGTKIVFRLKELDRIRDGDCHEDREEHREELRCEERERIRDGDRDADSGRGLRRCETDKGNSDGEKAPAGGAAARCEPQSGDDNGATGRAGVGGVCHGEVKDGGSPNLDPAGVLFAAPVGRQGGRSSMHGRCSPRGEGDVLRGGGRVGAIVGLGIGLRFPLGDRSAPSVEPTAGVRRVHKRLDASAFRVVALRCLPENSHILASPFGRASRGLFLPRRDCASHMSSLALFGPWFWRA